MVRGGSSGGGQSSLGYLFGSDAGPAKPAARAPGPPSPLPRCSEQTRPLAAQLEPAAALGPAPAAAPAAKVEESKVHLGRNSNNYHRADGQNTGNFITVSIPDP
jgi:SPIRAL1-like protein